jgi:cytochrome bd-type quinol oxidase subunit 1
MPDQHELRQPPAVQMSSQRVAAVGTIAFFVAFLALLPFYSWLGHHPGHHDHRIWLWTCLAGWIVGLFGWTLSNRHRKAGRTL